LESRALHLLEFGKENIYMRVVQHYRNLLFLMLAFYTLIGCHTVGAPDAEALVWLNLWGKRSEPAFVVEVSDRNILTISKYGFRQRDLRHEVQLSTEDAQEIRSLAATLFIEGLHKDPTERVSDSTSVYLRQRFATGSHVVLVSQAKHIDLQANPGLKTLLEAINRHLPPDWHVCSGGISNGDVSPEKMESS
jgi:hypothetical protein